MRVASQYCSQFAVRATAGAKAAKSNLTAFQVSVARVLGQQHHRLKCSGDAFDGFPFFNELPDSRADGWLSPRVDSFLSTEGMLSGVLLLDDFCGVRLTVDGADESLLGGPIVEVLDFLVVVGFPVNEHADANE